MVSTEHTIPDATALIGWTKSSHSGGSNGDCLEVAHGYDGVPIRDSKRPTGPALVFSAGSWSSFVSAVKRGELPL
ncbi:DUF397 domain-containing protein [Streptomyces sp. NPDC048595]|uniref:DUF397 domain-containing protein n=1 Tax=Streptomyces sp. NPDC048595 TaxID=3365576 RepID=UPI00371A12AD